MRAHSSLEKYKLSDGLAFEVYHENILQWLDMHLKADTFEEVANFFLWKIAECVGYMYEISDAGLLQLDVESVLDESGVVRRDVVEAFLADDRDVYAPDGCVLMESYANVRDVLSTYSYDEKAPSYSFEHNGVNYIVPAQSKRLLLGKKVFPTIKLGQSIDIQKIWKYIASVSKYTDQVSDKKDDLFTCYMQIVAILCLRQGEEYPDSAEDAKIFYQQRVVELQDISYVDAKNIIFFLITTGSA